MVKEARPEFSGLEAEVVIPVSLDGVVYNAHLKGPGRFSDLRKENYGRYSGKNFVRGTFGEQLTLLHGAYLNTNNRNFAADELISLVNNKGVSGDTGILYTPELIVVQDNPEINPKNEVIGHGILMDLDHLVSKIGETKIKGVRFSNDLKIRAIPYKFAEETLQTIDQIKENPFLIALTGDINAPEKLAQIFEIIKDQNKFHQMKIPEGIFVEGLNTDSEHMIRIPTIRRPNTISINGNFDYYWGFFNTASYSFGILK
ncbi:MAG: hypothetical protein AABX96_01050 [Nanoarchaeota archaeon]